MLVSLANSTRNHLCPGSGGPFAQTATPTGNPVAVSWKDDTTAYVAGADRGVVLKSVNGGLTWNDVSRRSDGTCLADAGSGALFSDVATPVGSDLVYVVTDSFGARRFSADGFAGPADARNNTSVVGAGGKIVTSTQASAMPDLIAPAGTISGPVNVTAGQAVTYTANVADNAGGSGIDPAAFQWSATGLPSATGNPVTLTFPSAGLYTLRVGFKDLSGNTGEATLTVSAGAPAIAASPPAPRSTSVTTTKKVSGVSIQLTRPRACMKAGGSFTATLSFKRSKKKGSKKVKITRVEFYIDKKRVKTDKKDPFRQRLTVRKLKAGSKHELRARAWIKVSKGKKTPKKSITTSFSVCKAA